MRPAHHDHTTESPPRVGRAEITVLRFLRGSGCCEESPVREVTVFYALDGTLIAEHDPARGELPLCGAMEPGPFTVGVAHECDAPAGHSGDHEW